MKIITCILASLLFLTSPGKAGIGGLFTQQRRDWDFIQSVGGMEVRLDERKLNISCNVSGLHRITTEPVAVNSGIGVRKVRYSRVGHFIRISVVTSLFEKGMSTSCGSIDLTKFPPADYSVEYLDADGTTYSLGQIILR